MTVVRAEDVAPQPWPNGGGTTRELLRAADRSWRISLAEIVSDGPFSVFGGQHRLLTVVDGPVLSLDVDGETHVVEPQRPFAFPGDAEVVASVPEEALVTTIDESYLLSQGAGSDLRKLVDTSLSFQQEADRNFLVPRPMRVLEVAVDWSRFSVAFSTVTAEHVSERIPDIESTAGGRHTG